MAGLGNKDLEVNKREQKGNVATSAVEKPKVTLLGSGWSSSAGGLSTLNRELAIQLSNHAEADVSLLVPEGACTYEEKIEACGCGINVVEAKKRPGYYDSLDWLSFPPKDHKIDIVFGHGVKLGRQGQVIRDSPQYENCKWVQVVHTAPEDLSAYKNYNNPISKGEKKHQAEVELCELADLVVPVGPRLKQAFFPCLRRNKTEQDVFTITPGLFEREFGDLVEKQDPNEDSEFKVLLIGRGDDEDFELKGYTIAARAFGDPRLKNKFYRLIFVGAPEEKQDEVQRRLVRFGISRGQLTVREFMKSREKIKNVFCEADLAIMPSRSEGFGLVGLEALSAGLPILVGFRSGFAKALEKVHYGKSCIVYSDEPSKWAQAIVAVRERHKSQLEDIKVLRTSYSEMYNWKKQCEDLSKKMQRMIYGASNVNAEETDPGFYAEKQIVGVIPEGLSRLPSKMTHSRQRLNSGRKETRAASLSEESSQRSLNFSLGSGTSVVNVEETGPDFFAEKQLVDVTLHGPSRLPSIGQTHNNEERLNSERKETCAASLSEESSQRFSNSSLGSGTQSITLQLRISAQDLDYQQQEIFYDSMRYMLLPMDCYTQSTAEQLDVLAGYFANYYKAHVLLHKVTNGGVKIKVECPNLESLASLLEGYQNHHLDKLAESCFVTDAIKNVLELETVKLKTVMKEESNYSELLRKAEIAKLQCKEIETAISAQWVDLSPRMTKALRGPLHKASISGQCDAVRSLLKIGVPVDQRDQFALTPLHLACWYGHELIVKMLLNHGADVNAMDRFCRTPLQKAERHNYHSIVKLLLDSNARRSFQQPVSLKSLAANAFLTVDNISGLNLLQAAVFEGKNVILYTATAILGTSRVLSEMNLKTTGNNASVFQGKSACDFVSSMEKKSLGHEKIEKFYLEIVEKESTLTELHRCNFGNDGEQAIELVLNDGVDIDIPALCNRTPLLWASLSSSSVFLETLVDLGADVNAQRTDDKVTPLKSAIHCNNFLAARLLLERGANANIADVDGYTPLHSAASLGYYNVTKLLIERGSIVNVRTKNGKTPLYFALKCKYKHIFKLLLENGADVSMGYKEDSTERVHLVRGKNRGKPRWHYVLVDKHLLGLFLKLTNGHSLDVKNFGDVLDSGWGVDPPGGTIDKILQENNAIFKDIHGQTLLHIASRNNDADAIDILVKHGAWEINTKDEEGYTPLHLATIHGNVQAVKMLVDLGADASQAGAIADLAHMNEEYDIEEYLKAKMGLKEREETEIVELNVRISNFFQVARSISREMARVVVDSASMAFR